MSYTPQQRLSPYYTDHLNVADSNIIAKNSHNSCVSLEPSTPPAAFQHHHSHHSLVSHLLHSSSIPSAATTTGSYSEPSKTYDEEDENSLQPLDLSIHRKKNEQGLKHTNDSEHKPICMVKSCRCSIQVQHSSTNTTQEQGTARSPNLELRLPSFKSTESPQYTEHQKPSSSYQNNPNKPTTSSVVYLSKPSAWTSTESSSFQLLATSSSVLNEIPNASGLYRSYDDDDDDLNHSDNLNLPEETKQREPTMTQRKPNIDYADNDDNYEPTYMDLDSVSSSVKNTERNDSVGSSSLPYRTQNIFHIYTSQTTNGRKESSHRIIRSTVAQALNSRKTDCSYSEAKSTPYCVDGVISHTSFDKSKPQAFPRGLQSSEQADQSHQQPQQQVHLPKSSSSPSVVSSTNTVHSTYSDLLTKTDVATTFQDAKSYNFNLHTTDNIYAAGKLHTGTMNSHIPSIPSHPENALFLPISTHASFTQNSQKNLLDKKLTHENRNRNGKLISRLTKTSNQSVSSSTYTREIFSNKHKRGGEPLDKNVHLSSLLNEDTENSTKISLLDYWISKILMERSSEAPQRNKPCNVDYICTANGDKRIRLRLVDLMELQVEQSSPPCNLALLSITTILFVISIFLWR